MTPPKAPNDEAQLHAELESAASRLNAKWSVGIAAGLLTLVSGAAISWAVNVDLTQRTLLQDVSSLQETREHVTDSLGRIEGKVDRLLELRSVP